ncbi:Metabotropic glutamate receptor 1 [Homalodisca vitripennis]|nr:Metabotropic glutamate receptor 1 [Homalodisca vitripennis]
MFDSDGWADRSDVADGYEAQAHGSLSIRIHSPYVTSFDHYYLQLNPFNNSRNPWFKEFWQARFNCSIPGEVVSLSKPRVCTVPLVEGVRGNWWMVVVLECPDYVVVLQVEAVPVDWWTVVALNGAGVLGLLYVVVLQVEGVPVDWWTVVALKRWDYVVVLQVEGVPVDWWTDYVVVLQVEGVPVGVTHNTKPSGRGTGRLVDGSAKRWDYVVVLQVEGVPWDYVVVLQVEGVPVDWWTVVTQNTKTTQHKTKNPHTKRWDYVVVLQVEGVPSTGGRTTMEGVPVDWWTMTGLGLCGSTQVEGVEGVPVTGGRSGAVLGLCGSTTSGRGTGRLVDVLQVEGVPVDWWTVVARWDYVVVLQVEGVPVDWWTVVALGLCGSTTSGRGTGRLVDGSGTGVLALCGVLQVEGVPVDWWTVVALECWDYVVVLQVGGVLVDW